MKAAKASPHGPLELLLEVPAGLFLQLGLLAVHVPGGLGPGGLLGGGLGLHLLDCLLVDKQLDFLGDANMEDKFIEPATEAWILLQVI